MSEALDLFLSVKKEVPDITYVLPSSGERIFMRPFTTKEQKSILKAIEKEDHVLLNEAFDQLLKNCVTNPGFNTDKLLAKDRECLLIKLRQESVKEEYVYRWKCEKCDAQNSYSYNLTNLPFTEIVNKNTLEDKEIVLSDRPITIIVGMTTRGDEKKIYEYAKKNSPNSKEVSHTELLNAAFAATIKAIKIKKPRTIKAADGTDKEIEEETRIDIPFIDRVKIFEEISMNDKAEMKKYLDNVDSYGYNLNLGIVKCVKCQHETEESLEWVSFFMM